MEALLAKDEVIVKEWDYSTSGGRFSKNKVHKLLTVTNKRLIASEEGKMDLTHNEIPLKDIVSVKGNYKKNDSIWIKIKMIAWIVFCCVIVGIFFGGIKKAMDYHYQLKSCALELTFTTTNRYGIGLGIGGIGEGGVAAETRLFGKGINKKITLVDKDVAREILSTIGAVILENK